jgi:hypothetical protein
MDSADYGDSSVASATLRMVSNSRSNRARLPGFFKRLSTYRPSALGLNTTAQSLEQHCQQNPAFAGLFNRGDQFESAC